MRGQTLSVRGKSFSVCERILSVRSETISVQRQKSHVLIKYSRREAGLEEEPSINIPEMALLSEEALVEDWKQT